MHLSFCLFVAFVHLWHLLVSLLSMMFMLYKCDADDVDDDILLFKECCRSVNQKMGGAQVDTSFIKR